MIKSNKNNAIKTTQQNNRNLNNNPLFNSLRIRTMDY